MSGDEAKAEQGSKERERRRAEIPRLKEKQGEKTKKRVSRLKWAIREQPRITTMDAFPRSWFYYSGRGCFVDDSEGDLLLVDGRQGRDLELRLRVKLRRFFRLKCPESSDTIRGLECWVHCKQSAGG